MVALAGYGAAIGAAAVPLPLLTLAGAPPVIEFLPGRVGGRAGHRADDPRPDSDEAAMGGAAVQRHEQATSTDDAAAVAGPADVTDLSAADLCTAWRRSFTALQRAQTQTECLRLVARREAYLDEMERRKPVAFAAWREAGARAAGDPSRIFARSQD